MNKRIAELEAFVKKFLDNFEDCEYCDGKGTHLDGELQCPGCSGTGKHLISIGVLYVELPDEASTLLNKDGTP